MSDNNNKNNKMRVGTIEVYTDGCYRKKGLREVCGYGIYFPNGELRNVAAPLRMDNITNNRAELYAIYQAIVKIKNRSIFDKIIIYSDSKYSVNSVTVWIDNWKKNGWMNSKKKPVINQDIIKNIDKYLQKYNDKISIRWVKGHTGLKDNNDMADKLANKGADKYLE